MTRRGSMPAAAVYTASLPTAIWMPPTPQSPMPRISSASVQTIRAPPGGAGSSVGNALTISCGWGVVEGQEDAGGPPVFVGVPLDRVADSRVVDDRQQLGEVVGQYPVVQGLVA